MPEMSLVVSQLMAEHASQIGTREPFLDLAYSGSLSADYGQKHHPGAGNPSATRVNGNAIIPQ